MAKTRSQTGNITIKKEEDCKPTLEADSLTLTARNKITKRKPPRNKSLRAQQVKLEEDTDTKSLLQSSSKYSKRGENKKISQEQINQLIHYIVNDNISVNKASQKVNISVTSGSDYYNIYKNDPEKRIPLPRDLIPKNYTQEQVGNLIGYINDDKMTVKDASTKADMPYSSAYQYYNRYLKDPNHNIPVPHLHQYYTQDQKNEFIDYVINDKMSIKAASKKAKMNAGTAKDYYNKYFKQQNPDIARPSHIATLKCYTQEQIKEVLGYIIDGKMSIRAASRKVNMDPSTAGRYCQQYLKDNNIEHFVRKKTYTQGDINKLIGYIADNKMTIKAASKKVKMSYSCAKRYYRKYCLDRNIGVPIQNVITQEQKTELIGYIVDDKMSISAASKKANMGVRCGTKYYQRYLKDHNMDVPIRKPYTQE